MASSMEYTEALKIAKSVALFWQVGTHGQGMRTYVKGSGSELR